MKTILQHIKYEHNQWVICVDLKMVNFLLGQHSGYTKFPCFLCYWHSWNKANHWKIKKFPVREQLKVGDRNVIHDHLVPREKNHISSFTRQTKTYFSFNWLPGYVLWKLFKVFQEIVKLTTTSILYRSYQITFKLLA